MRVVVVGNEGLLGSAIVRHWQSADAAPRVEVFGLDLPDFDVASRRTVLETLDDLRADVVVSATNISDRDYLESHPNTARSVLVSGTAHLREAAQRRGALLVQISCVEAVSGDSVFAQTRRDAERAASEYERHLIVRGSMFFGRAAARSCGNIVETLLTASRRATVSRTPFRIVSDLIFSPTWSDDFAAALAQLITSGRTGVYEIANGGTASYWDLATEVVRRAGLRLNIAPMTSEELGGTAPRGPAAVTDSAVPLRTWQESLAAYLESRQK